MTRRTITARLARDIIIRQLAEGYAVRNNGSVRIGCAICHKPISMLEKTTWEHGVPLALGGPDDETNIRLCHKTCSDRKTNGPAHLKVDGDKSKIAKSKRLSKAHSALQAGEKKAVNHKWPKRKLQSRGFQKKVASKENQSD